MILEEAIRGRDIREVLHFTTNFGLAGVLATKTVKPRNLLTTDDYLEHIYKPNCEDRSRDIMWHDYVNLSITRINTRLFGISSGNWHCDINGWWCILSFHPAILVHPGVVFTTTNNMYSGVTRAQGVKGFEAMFAPIIRQWWSSIVTRSPEIPACQPTCRQAEVLYPGELSIDHLRRIYVRDEEPLDEIAGMFGGLTVPPLPTTVRPDAFRDSGATGLALPVGLCDRFMRPRAKVVSSGCRDMGRGVAFLS